MGGREREDGEKYVLQCFAVPQQSLYGIVKPSQEDCNGGIDGSVATKHMLAIPSIPLVQTFPI